MPGLPSDIRSVGTRSCLVVSWVRQSPEIKQLSKSTSLSETSQRPRAHAQTFCQLRNSGKHHPRIHVGEPGRGFPPLALPRPKADSRGPRCSGELSSCDGGWIGIWRLPDPDPGPWVGVGESALTAIFLVGRRQPGQASGKPNLLGERTVWCVLGWGWGEEQEVSSLLHPEAICFKIQPLVLLPGSNMEPPRLC